MPTIEERALALVNEVAGFDYLIAGDVMDDDRDYMLKALCRALEAHDATLAEFEAFRRKVSDKAEVVKKLHPTAACYLGDLILPKPVDPLVEAIREASVSDADDGDASRLRAALAARGLKLVEVGDA
jgi:hypothetical protein